MTSWLRALVDPRAIARPAYFSTDLVTAPALLAILVTGNVEGFARIAGRRGLPLPDYLSLYASSSDDAEESRLGLSQATTDVDILLGALEFVVGRPTEAVSKLSSLSILSEDECADPPDQEKVACAAVISALALTDSGDSAAAINLLEQRLLHLTDEYSRLVTVLHLAALSIDKNDTDAASKAHALWQEVLSSGITPDENAPAGAVDLDKLLTAVATRGIEHYNMQHGQITMHEDGTEFAARRVVDSLENDNMAALAYKLIDDEFTTSSQSVQTTIVSFGGDYDPTEDTLAKALLRARFLADPITVRKTRATLARYQMTRVYGSREADPAVSALHALLVARDSRGVERAVQRLRRSGPSIAVRHVAVDLIEDITSSIVPRVDGITPSTLPIFRTASDMLSTKEADDLLLVVTGLLSDSSSTRVNLSDMDLVRLSADLAITASESMQDRLIDMLISGNRERADDIFYETLANKIRWKDATPSKVSNTFDWIEQALSANNSPPSARSALQGIASTDPTRALHAARSTIVSNPSVNTAALLWNVGVDSELTSTDIETIESIALRGLKSVRAQARKNVYAMPSGLHAIDLLVRIARSRRKESVWRELIEFCLDRSVATHDRVRSARSLIEASSLLPAHLVDAIAQSMSTTLMTDDANYTTEKISSLESSQHLTITELALAYTVGVIPLPILEMKLIELMSSQDARRRHEIAEVLSSLSYPGLRPFSSLTPLCMALCRDSVTEVRAVSLHTTARLFAHEDDSSVKDSMINLLIDGIRDPGIHSVAYTLQGLVHADTAIIVGELREAIIASRSHPSKKIRDFASRIVVSDVKRES